MAGVDCNVGWQEHLVCASFRYLQKQKSFNQNLELCLTYCLLVNFSLTLFILQTRSEELNMKLASGGWWTPLTPCLIGFAKSCHLSETHRNCCCLAAEEGTSKSRGITAKSCVNATRSYLFSTTQIRKHKHDSPNRLCDWSKHAAFPVCFTAFDGLWVTWRSSWKKPLWNLSGQLVIITPTRADTDRWGKPLKISLFSTVRADNRASSRPGHGTAFLAIWKKDRGQFEAKSISTVSEGVPHRGW